MSHVNRRQFLAAGAAAVASPSLSAEFLRPSSSKEDPRDLFPRASREVFLNAAVGSPLNKHTLRGLQQYLDFQTLGPSEGRGEAVQHALAETRRLFAELIGADTEEIGFVSCTKAGENLVVHGLDLPRGPGNVVTNDLHFAGSIHQYLGHRKAGMDVRIVRHRDWRIEIDDMAEAMDDQTKLVAITLVSNINGWVEDVKALADLAHNHGAYLYADIIQAAGIVPIDVKAMGIDFAACSAYKWLHGLHGTGFLYVRKELQGTALRDLHKPGQTRFQYAPWIDSPSGDGAMLMTFTEPTDARRYEPGHPCYAGYVGLHEALKYIHETGVERRLEHSVRLLQPLREELPKLGMRCITHPTRTPIATFLCPEFEATREKLMKADITVAIGAHRMRVSPAIYNTMDDIQSLLSALA